jgi:hypothetical protein
MNPVAVGLIVLAALLVLYIAARTSRSPKRNPSTHARDPARGRPPV